MIVSLVCSIALCMVRIWSKCSRCFGCSLLLPTFDEAEQSKSDDGPDDGSNDSSDNGSYWGGSLGIFVLCWILTGFTGQVCV